MNDKLQTAFQNLIPFILIGVVIALFIGLLFMFFYIAVWGLIIGGVLWIAALVKQYLFPSKSVDKEQGRVIEHDDKK
jgi:5-bromo-4-chloroindolyl phosphate hydrolysis protein